MGTKKKLKQVFKEIARLDGIVHDLQTKSIPVVSEELKPDFVLPEKWCIKTTQNSDVHNWFNNKLNRTVACNSKLPYLHYPEFRNRVSASDIIIGGYTEITTEQFKYGVLGEKQSQTEPEEIDWYKPGQTFISHKGVKVLNTGRHNSGGKSWNDFEGICIEDSEFGKKGDYYEHWDKDNFKLHKEPVTIQNY